MGVTIHYALGMQSGRVPKALDRTEALAEDIKREQAAALGVPFNIRRLKPTHLLIDIGECETLAFEFNVHDVYARAAAEGWNYEQRVLGDLYAERVLGVQGLMWSCAFCKTQFAKSLAEHRWVAELIRALASVAEYAHVYDEGGYYHTLDIDDAAHAIHQNSLLIGAIGAKLDTIFGNGARIVTGGRTTIKPLKKHAAPADDYQPPNQTS
jgi:hypothetical protein